MFLKARVNILALDLPRQCKKYKQIIEKEKEIRVFYCLALKNEEEIRVFYCLALKNEEEIRRRWGKTQASWPKYLPPLNIRTFFVINVITLGSGSYGDVYLCHPYIDDQVYAAKVSHFGKDFRRRWLAENESEVTRISFAFPNQERLRNIPCILHTRSQWTHVK